eukprot:m.224482 g.224482  ORF g.224482 m.224482 type:complete len:104 (+) comp17290_c0_seq5:1892-2203(+)
MVDRQQVWFQQRCHFPHQHSQSKHIRTLFTTLATQHLRRRVSKRGGSMCSSTCSSDLEGVRCRPRRRDSCDNTLEPVPLLVEFRRTAASRCILMEPKSATLAT